MKTRILVAAIGLPLLLVVVLVLPAAATAVLVAAMCAIAVYELLFSAGFLRHVRVLIYSALAAVLVCVWSATGMNRAVGSAIVLLYLAAILCEMLAAHTKLRFRSVCVALFAGLAIPYLLGALIRIRCMEQGKFFILIAFILTMLPDSGAYFVGRALGKRKLAPIISPNKTVEGAIGGMLAGVAGMLLYALILQLAFGFRVNYFYAVVYGVLGSAGSILGDLAFSVIKRQAKIKDYGNLLPGHGGILDRFDSTMVVAPLVELMLLVIPVAVKLEPAAEIVEELVS